MEFLQKPSIGFDSVRDMRRSLPLYIDIDLTAARSISAGTALIINIAGNSFYVDADTLNVGNATVHFQDTTLSNASAPFFVSAGFIANVPFTQILVENAAQAGKRLRIFYGVDIDFQAGVNASIAITGTVNIGNAKSTPGNIVDAGFDYTGSYKSLTLLAANTPETIFLPAANTNGAILWTAFDYGVSASTTPGSAIIAKTSAPTTVIDGDVIVSTHTLTPGASNDGTGFSLIRPVKIAAGKGLYYITGDVKTKALRSALYTLL